MEGINPIVIVRAVTVIVIDKLSEKSEVRKEPFFLLVVLLFSWESEVQRNSTVQGEGKT